MLGSAAGKVGWSDKAEFLVLCAMAMIAMSGGALVAKPAQAETFTVNSSGDATDRNTSTESSCWTGGLIRGGLIQAECTLRAAIQQANATPGTDIINFSVNAATLTILGTDENAAATGDLDITEALTINGGGVVISTNYDGTSTNTTDFNDRIFQIISPAVATVDGVTATKGVSGNPVANSFVAANAGGIQVDAGARLNLNRSTISRNRATGDGAGISNDGTLTMTASTVGDNTLNPFASPQGKGGGINNTGALTMTNSTVYFNMIDDLGAGSTDPEAGIGGGIRNGGTLAITNSTIVGNGARLGDNVFNDVAGGGTETSGQISFKNTIVGRSWNGSDPNCFGTAASNSKGHNLGSDDSCGFTASGDIQNEDPLLNLPLDNGGPTQTLALLPGSPAIDAASTASAPAVDQRGVYRPQGAAADIGAFEVDVAPTVSVTTPRTRRGNATVRFSEPMAPATLMQDTTDPVSQPSTSQTIVLLKGTSASTTTVAAKVRCTDSTCKTLILNPDNRLAKLKRYTVKVEGATDIEAVVDTLAVEDSRNNKLDRDYAKSFRTGTI